LIRGMNSGAWYPSAMACKGIARAGSDPKSSISRPSK